MVRQTAVGQDHRVAVPALVPLADLRASSDPTAHDLGEALAIAWGRARSRRGVHLWRRHDGGYGATAGGRRYVVDADRRGGRGRVNAWVVCEVVRDGDPDGRSWVTTEGTLRAVRRYLAECDTLDANG